MVSVLANFWISFLAGVFAPVAAVCIIPLYPAFLAYLSSQLSGKTTKKTIIMFGVIVTLGVLVSMFIFGLIFVFLLQESLTAAIGVVSPIAFAILAVVSIFLIFGKDIGGFIPKIKRPTAKNPYVSSFVFGFFFGAVVLPCNPASLIVLFAVSTSTVTFVANLFNFAFFGIGMALPLLVFSVVSAQWSKQVIGYLTRYNRQINLIAGVILLAVSLYYLIVVFRVFG